MFKLAPCWSGQLTATYALVRFNAHRCVVCGPPDQCDVACRYIDQSCTPSQGPGRVGRQIHHRPLSSSYFCDLLQPEPAKSEKASKGCEEAAEGCQTVAQGCKEQQALKSGFHQCKAACAALQFAAAQAASQNAYCYQKHHDAGS